MGKKLYLRHGNINKTHFQDMKRHSFLLVLLAACSMQAQHTFQNPVIPTDWPDPTIWKAGDTYYSVATGLKTLRTSKDMVNWTDTEQSPITQKGRDSLEAYAPNIWAPSVAKIGKKWMLYVSSYKDDTNCRISVFSSKKPEGPFKWEGFLLDGVRDCNVINSIDPFVIENEGQVLLFYGSLEDGIHVQHLTDDGLALAPGSEPKHIGGVRRPKNKFVKEAYEGTYVMKHGGWWYLFCSGGAYYDETYHLSVARSRDIEGPYYDKEGNPLTEGKALPLLASKKRDRFVGPGHNGDVFATPDGRTFMFYHSHDKTLDKDSRPTLLQEVLWDAEGWPYFRGGKPALHEEYPL